MIKTVTIVSLLLVLLFGAGCISPNFEHELGTIVQPYRFSIANWELQTIIHETRERIYAQNENAETGVADTVTEYFILGNKIDALKSEAGASGYERETDLKMLEERRNALASRVARIIAQQTERTLTEQGIFHPLYQYIRLKANFPPAYFRLVTPPYLLVISPRDRIDTIETIFLRSDLDLSTREDIEAKVDQLNVSSLVVELGGSGATYPALINSNADLQFVLETAAHEWLHQYLFFTPLGFRYVLDLSGISPNYEIATMNETLANMVGKEIGTIVRQKYYAGYGGSNPPVASPVLNFDREMRDVRKTVDHYLSQGEIELAERFMEQKQMYLASKGYYIRKLNQAYFAFHGEYADIPAFESPTGLELKELRARSATLSNFLDTVAVMTSRQDLQLALKNISQK